MFYLSLYPQHLVQCLFKAVGSQVFIEGIAESTLREASSAAGQHYVLSEPTYV